MTTYYDYRFKFTDLNLALGAFTALRTAGVLGVKELPTNMLGEPVTINGVMVARAIRGRAETDVEGMDGQPIHIPAAGDPAYWYVHIRSEVAPAALGGLNFASFGLVPIGADEASAVLGVWA